MLGLFEMEVCFAVYPPGGFYDRHLDSFAGARNRVVSLVAYLNEDWDEARGGALGPKVPGSRTPRPRESFRSRAAWS